MNFILSSDSCCDCFKSELANNNVHYVPLAYIHNGETYYDNVDSERDYRDFYSFIRGGNLPSTTQLNVVELEEYFEKLLSEEEGDLVHLTLSSGLSGTYDNAVAAAAEVMKKHPDRQVFIVDSLSATQVQNYILDRMIKDRVKGMTAEETYKDAVALTKRMNVYVLPRDLFHLHRGGRVNRATAIVGSMLQIKPIIQFNKVGKLVVTSKVNGWTRGLRYLAKAVLRGATDLQNDEVWIAHADAHEDACELKTIIQEYANVSVRTGWIGPIIGTHTGPGTIGLIFVGKERDI